MPHLFNAGCAERALERVEQTVARLAAGGAAVAVVGHSRGGHLARAAARRPELVSHVVAMGSGLTLPVRGGRAASPLSPSPVRSRAAPAGAGA